MACATTLALFAAAGRVAAADLTAQDFAFGVPVVTTGDAAAYRFALPLDVYRDSARDDLGDVRVFNARGEAVPYSLLRASPPAQTHAAAAALPLLPLRGAARAMLDGTRLVSDPPLPVAGPASQNPASSTSQNPGGLKPAVYQYVVDGRGLRSPVAVFELEWADSSADYSGRVKIEGSDDLEAWQTLVAAAPTANLHANGQVLLENRVVLAPTRARFWRISWVGPPPRFELSAVLAEAADSPQETRYESLDVEGTASPGETDADVFDLGAHLPVSRVNVTLPEANTVIGIELSSRRAPGNPWRSVTQSSFYRMRTADGEQHNAVIDIPVDRDRYWRAHILQGGGLSRLPLRLHLEWIPNQVTFLARGQPPFLLVYGNAAVASAEFELSELPTDVDIAVATPGAPRTLGTAGRPVVKSAPGVLRGWVLLGALLLAVALCWWVYRQTASAR